MGKLVKKLKKDSQSTELSTKNKKTKKQRKVYRVLQRNLEDDELLYEDPLEIYTPYMGKELK